MQKDTNIQDNKNYQHLLGDIQSLIDKGKYKAYKAFDNILVQTNWQIGERIVREELKQKDRADYGKFLISNLALDLSIDRKELYKIVKFYRYYENVGSLIRQLSWTHYYQLINIENSKKRNFYEQKIILHSLSVRELRKQIKNKLYENTSLKEIEKITSAKLPATTSNETFKDSLNFDFIQLSAKHKENELEEKIMQNIKHFLNELGADFGFFGQQVPIKIDKITHSIDLVLYNKAIPCSVLVDLKARKFDSADVGQMNKYINYFIANKQHEHEKNAIGLIICTDTGVEEAKYTLGSITNKIFISKYKVKLPSEAKIKKAVKNLNNLS